MSVLNRRQTLAVLASTAGAGLLPETATAAVAKKPAFIPCLNMSTIRGQKLGFVKELETASKAGFRSVEIWMDTLQNFIKEGNTPAQARKIVGDLGITIENAIGFAPWIVDDEAARAKGLAQLKTEMELLAEVGCMRVATPSVGAQTPQSPKIDLQKAAERYRAILEISDQTKVIPHLELWGFSKNLNKLSEVMYVATESGHPSARLLLDVYHLYKGGSSLDTLKLVGKPGVEIFHINDYPASLPRETIVDADRIYPGDGVAPIAQILKTIKNPDRPIVLSLEVFNKTYYAQDALVVAKTGLDKINKVIAGI
ncbi:sugar phosphate isomerase/epimerase [Runella rosea]|uniref:Sugar phosphate isomerase/epimerase n=2 Tax=Runella TaxID=105 RepID=A0A344TDK9_9BACT|nr:MULTISPECIES: sugar phosphate isomerase/epimerase family protein [Runella]AXE16730.1 sugar phosphate isomerase/epimerase [Runella rosea]MCP1382337.1 sugar phosphate isomerase/epimerase [Runella salmonicolor]